MTDRGSYGLISEKSGNHIDLFILKSESKGSITAHTTLKYTKYMTNIRFLLEEAYMVLVFGLTYVMIHS